MRPFQILTCFDESGALFFFVRRMTLCDQYEYPSWTMRAFQCSFLDASSRLDFVIRLSELGWTWDPIGALQRSVFASGACLHNSDLLGWFSLSRF